MTRLQTYENAAHVLSELISFHQELSDQYDSLAGKSSNALSALLLQFMAEREKKLAVTLERYEESAPYKVLKTWIQIPYPEDLESFLGSLQVEMTPDLEPEQVYELGSKVDGFVAGLLTHLQDSCAISEVKALFKDLLKGEHDEGIALSKAYNSLREF
ncbi:MAG: hypothetical protein Q7W55_04485 [Pseudohongiella sp.]|nr:hypothetical protein [Pseudohongiella sp.]MDO9521819.1 hypothetical protein [Pseudohongiella sp.]MDP2128541.1 hypothetical protein [Pseudohongiella sp.]